MVHASSDSRYIPPITLGLLPFPIHSFFVVNASHWVSPVIHSVHVVLSGREKHAPSAIQISAEHFPLNTESPFEHALHSSFFLLSASTQKPVFNSFDAGTQPHSFLSPARQLFMVQASSVL